MKKYSQKRRSRKGMAMLMILFIVMAISIISSGFIARSDASLASGRNGCLRSEVDYLAWGGLEHAWALVQDPNTLAALPLSSQQLDTDSDHYYDISIDTTTEADSSDPNETAYIYDVECSAYKQVNGQQRAVTTLHGDLYHDPVGQTYYLSVSYE